MYESIKREPKFACTSVPALRYPADNILLKTKHFIFRKAAS